MILKSGGNYSFILTILVILVGIVVVVFLLRSNKEGFQQPGAAVSNGPEKLELQRKITDIQSTAKLVQAAKKKEEATLSRVMDSETLSILDFMLAEVMFFEEPSAERESAMKTLDAFDTLAEKEKEVLRMMIHIAHQQAQVLLYVYTTLPATVIASNLLVDSNTAGPDTIADPAVLAETKQTIQYLLAKLPSPTALQKKAEEELADVIQRAGADGGKAIDAVLVGQLADAFSKYKRLTDNVLFIHNQALLRAKVSMDAAVKGVGIDASKAGMPGYSPDGVNVADPAVKLATEEVDMAKKQSIAVLDKVAKTMQGFSTQISTAADANSENMGLAAVRKTMNTAARTYQDMLEAAQVGSGAAAGGAKEGFASVGNPYSSPSPNIQQAFEFRLGKRELVDTVMQVAR